MNKWIFIISNLSKKHKIENCPFCNEKTLEYKYTIVDKKNKMGYLDIICSNCKENIHISRIKVE